MWNIYDYGDSAEVVMTHVTIGYPRCKHTLCTARPPDNTLEETTVDLLQEIAKGHERGKDGKP